MAVVERPDGAVIHYEVFGPPAGFPLLLIAPGGVSSEIGFWRRSLINPIDAFADEFRVIAMDQRHAGGSWRAPAAFSYELAAGDQIAVLDALEVERAHVYGGCIGVAHVLNVISFAPARIAAGIGQDPVGLDHTNSIDTFMAMFQPTIELARAEGTSAVVREALRDPLFVNNNAAGPLAPRLHEDEAFRTEIDGMPATDYVALVERIAAGYWPERPPYFTVDDAWLRECPAPLLILPGSDSFHPTSVAQRICELAPRARCLDVDCRSEAKRATTIEAIRAFMQEHAQ